MDVKYCKCGCNTALKKKKSIWAKNHHGRKSPVDFVVEDHSYKSCCWIWKLKLEWTGYGRIKRNGKSHTVHVYYWEAINGKKPQGMELDHLCRVRACMRPDHLELVTHKENDRRGASARLKEENISEIFSLYNSGITMKNIARMFSISRGHVSDIIRETKWNNVSEIKRMRRYNKEGDFKWAVSAQRS